jgi:hypothetical protein
MKTQAVILACVVSLTSCTVHRSLFQGCPHISYIRTELPLTFTGYESRYPVVAVGIQGRQYRLMVDTGSPDEAIALTREALTHLDVRYTGKLRVFRDAYGDCYESREFIIPVVELGDLELRTVLANERHQSVYGLDGAIGLDLLDKFDVLVDYEGSTMTLYRPKHVPVALSEGSWFRYRYDGNLYLGVRFGFLEGEYELSLDSGCGCNFIGLGSDLGRAMLSALGDGGRTITVGVGRGARCLSYAIEHYYLGNYDIGGGHFVLGALPPHLRNGVIGYDLFANNTVYIRFSAGEIWLKPVSSARYAATPRGDPPAGHVTVPSVSAFGHIGSPGSIGILDAAPPGRPGPR